MNSKVSLIIVVTILVHTSSFCTLCDAFPLWNYLFDSSEKSSAEVETESNANSNAIPETKLQIETVTPPAVVQETIASNTKDTSINDSSTSGKKSSRERFDVKPFIQNAGIARAPIGFFAGLAKIGTDGLKSVVQTGTDLGSTTIDQASMLRDKVIDSTQDAIEKGTQKSLDNIVPMMSRLDTYRRSFSGGTKANADKAHSITITTSSDAPINSMYSFAKDFMPAGATGSSALPPITSIDFSQFLR